MTSTQDKVIQTTMMCSFVLMCKFLFCLVAQGGAKGKAGMRAPEDAGLVKRGGWTDKQSFAGVGSTEAIDSANRWNRIIMNDLENIPLALILAWGSVFSGVGSNDSSADRFMAFLIIFTVSRVFHTVSFVFALQPWRTVFWVIALISMLAFSIVGVYEAFEDK